MAGHRTFVSGHRRWEVEAVFDAALDQPASAREEWLAVMCADDPALLAEVLALLAAHDLAERVLGGESAAPGARARVESIGPYRVLRELGRGGMGVVYLAERSDGQYRQRVAVKVVRAGAEGEAHRARFVAERQILAGLDHPNVARLLDGGVTEGARPYLVMEYVEGLPITAYCDEHALGVEERLALFREVCAAVHHAHQNLVIHRDLKPSNILVTPAGQVKLLDFGIAKLLNPALAGATAPVTATLARAMTPEYASPEQVRGDALTTASDLYSLGVLLYELLTGARPYEVSRESVGAMMRTVCEVDPARPSAHVAAAGPAAERASRARGTTPDRLRRRLQGDLDAIVMLAMRKEPNRRYGSAELLAADVTRHLQGHAVMAHQGSRWYRTRKLLVRHRVAAAAAALALASLVGGTGVALWQADVARQARDRADDARARAEVALRESQEVSDFLMGLFRANDPTETTGAELTARDLLQRGLARVELLESEPLVQARLLEVVGRVHEMRAQYAEAQPLLERALALRRQTLPADHPEVAVSLTALGTLVRRRGDHVAAEGLYREALALRRGALGARHPDVAASLIDLAWVRARVPVEAESLYREALAIREETLAPGDPRTSDARLMLASIVRRHGRYDEAERHFRRVLAERRSTRPAGDPLIAEAMVHLADFLHEHRQRADDAEALYREALPILRQRRDRLSNLVHNLHSLGELLAARGRLDEAEGFFREAWRVQREVYGPEYPPAVGSLSGVARIERRRGRLAAAESLYREILAQWERVYGPENVTVSAALLNLGDLVLARGRAREAEELLRRAVTIRERFHGATAPLPASSLPRLADAVAAQGRLEEAEALYQRALWVLQQHFPSDHVEVLATHDRLATLYERWGRPDPARRHRELAGPDSVFRHVWPR